jgi:hypothetical protein
LILPGFFILSRGIAHGGTAVLLPSADTTLFEAFPSNNLGKVESLISGTTASQFRSRAVMQFDLTGRIPSNAAITSASLILTVVRSPGGGTNSNFELHRLSQAWGEGAAAGDALSTGASANPGEATWNARFFPSTLWSAPGGGAPLDFVSAASTTTFISGLGSYQFTNLAADVQYWLTNTSGNFGWILLSQKESAATTARRFGSREDCFNPPLLVIEGDFLSPPLRIHCEELAGTNFILHFADAPGHAYVVEYRDAFDTNNWNVLTNLPVQSTARSIVITNPLTSSARFFRVGLQ